MMAAAKKKKRAMSEELLGLLARRFSVLGEPARLTILHSLLEGEQTVSELIEETGLNQANLSKHLQVLRSAGFVDRRKEGLYSIYRVVDPTVEPLCELVCERLDELADERTALLAD